MPTLKKALEDKKVPKWIQKSEIWKNSEKYENLPL
jgi:hypothetical protein